MQKAAQSHKAKRGRPVVAPEIKRTAFPVYFPPELKERVAEEAKRERRTVSGFVVRVVEQYLQENKML